MSDGSVSVEVATPRKESSARKGLAILVAFIWPSGPGHLVIGHKRRAWAWTGAVAAFLLFAELLTALTGNGRFMIAGVAGILFFHVLSAIDVARLERKHPLPGFGSFLFNFLQLIVAMVAVAVVLRITLVEAFQIPSGSMNPTLRVGDHIFVSKLVHGYQRGDVAIFRYPLDHTTSYLKRVVGLPGDVIEQQNGELSINGRIVSRREVDEPCDGCKVYEETFEGRTWRISLDLGFQGDFPATTVPPRKYFVLGDNRANSSDSRVWGFVDEAEMKGKALNVWWSTRPDHSVDWSRINLPVR
jgi:signal peptidase I